jgi:hypothetical protein
MATLALGSFVTAPLYANRGLASRIMVGMVPCYLPLELMGPNRF